MRSGSCLWNGVRVVLLPLLALAVVLGAAGPCRGWPCSLAAPKVLSAGEDEAIQATGQHHCRLWGAIAETVSPRVIQAHLLDLPYAMAHLGRSNPDGWGLVGFSRNGGTPLIRRGREPASSDASFAPAVATLEQSQPYIALCHVRICTSGLCDIPDPHPFHRETNGRHWFLAHNGGIDKEILLSLLRAQYLRDNPPETGRDPSEWIDSELYFLYVLQTCADFGGDVESALGEVISRLRSHIPEDDRYFNMLLTDGETLWAYREGLSLLYFHGREGGTPFTVVASRQPTSGQGEWSRMDDGELLIAERAGSFRVERIEDLVRPTVVVEAAQSPGASAGLCGLPNPCVGHSLIRCTLPLGGGVDLAVFDVLGHRVADIVVDDLEAGIHEFVWEGRDQQGRRLGNGVYLLRLVCASGLACGKLSLLR